MDYLRGLYRNFKIDEDYVIEHNDEIGYMLFHRRVERRRNCIKCYKNKRQHQSYCNNCDRIEFQQYLERCIENGWGDGCD